MMLNLLFLVLKIKNLSVRSAQTLFLCYGGLGGLYNSFLYKNTYIEKITLPTNPVKSRVQILIVNKGMAL